DIDINTGPIAAVVGARRGVLPTTPSATLTGLNVPSALAFDAQGNLFVANRDANTVSKYAPGSTAPTATLTVPVGRGASGSAFDADGNLFVANGTGVTVGVFAPVRTTPTSTIPGLNGPRVLAFDAHGNLFVNNGRNTVSVFAPGRTTPSATLTGL